MTIFKECLEQISWTTPDINGSTIAYSKSHYFNGGDKTVCGVEVPDLASGKDVEAGSNSNAGCKRCQKIYDKAE